MMLIDGFYELFEGREDAVFVDNPPRQLKENPKDWVGVHIFGAEFTRPEPWKPLTIEANIGIYPLRDGNRCKWICSDFDTQDSEELAWRYAQAWEYYGIQAWVETSKSKGHHVWVFSDDWMSGTIARRAGLWIHEMVGIEAVELNPKQELLEEGGYGNCVRLPYPQSRNVGRQVMWKEQGVLEPGGRVSNWHLEAFVEVALATRTPVATLQRLAAMWKPPVHEHRKQYDDDHRPSGGHRGADDPYHIRRVFYGHETVRMGERDNVFHCLAQYCKARGMSSSAARDVIAEVWYQRTEDPASYPLKTAMEKIDRVYRT